jgi:hypothetical protein
VADKECNAIIDPFSTATRSAAGANLRLQRKRKVDDFEVRILAAIEKPQQNPTDPHQLFFDSILSSVTHFNDDETLEFRMGVLQLIKTIKRRRHPSAPPQCSGFQQHSTPHITHFLLIIHLRTNNVLSLKMIVVIKLLSYTSHHHQVQ